MVSMSSWRSVRVRLPQAAGRGAGGRTVLGGMWGALEAAIKDA